MTSSDREQLICIACVALFVLAVIATLYVNRKPAAPAFGGCTAPKRGETLFVAIRLLDSGDFSFECIRPGGARAQR